MSHNVKLNWDGDHCRSVIVAEVKRRIRSCCEIVHDHAGELLNIVGTGQSIKSHVASYGGEKKKKYKKRATIYGFVRSDPGEPPRKQRGRLQGSVAFAIEGLIGRVGTNLKYGRWLELGTRKMKARPWLRRAFNECQAQIQTILRQPMKGP
jgi:HK97 gp10 family phage protein